MIPLVQILGGGPPRSEKLKCQKKIGKHTITKTQFFLLEKIITVKATLWQTIRPFKKCDLLFIAFFGHNATGKFHGWVNTMGE